MPEHIRKTWYAQSPSTKIATTPPAAASVISTPFKTPLLSIFGAVSDSLWLPPKEARRYHKRKGITVIPSRQTEDVKPKKNK
jgi:hypothetical protein